MTTGTDYQVSNCVTLASDGRHEALYPGVKHIVTN